mgnify:CR=1 FL=1
MFIRRSPDILPSEITDQDLYLNRRKFLTVAGVTLGAALVEQAPRAKVPSESANERG